MGLGVGTRVCASLTSCSALPSQHLVLMELLQHSHCHFFSHHPSTHVAKQRLHQPQGVIDTVLAPWDIL